jgi:cell division protein DivIC
LIQGKAEPAVPKRPPDAGFSKEKSMKQSKKKRTRPVSRQNRIQTGIIIFIVCMVIGAVAFNSYSIKEKEKEYAAQEAELDLQISEAKAEKQALEEQEEYMKTDAYKEQVAREEFGMVKKGEYILKEKDSDE